MSYTPHTRDQHLTDLDRYELGDLLGLDGPAHHQGVSVPAVTFYGWRPVDTNGKAQIELRSTYRDGKRIATVPTGVVYQSMKAAEMAVGAKNRAIAESR